MIIRICHIFFLLSKTQNPPFLLLEMIIGSASAAIQTKEKRNKGLNTASKSYNTFSYSKG